MSDPGPIVYLSVEDLFLLAEIVIGGRPAVRDVGLLESSAVRPATVAFGHVAYPGLFDKAAALMCSLCMNHALVDDNRRLAWSAAVAFLALNGRAVPDIDVDAAEDLVLSNADGLLENVEEVGRRLQALYGLKDR